MAAAVVAGAVVVGAAIAVPVILLGRGGASSPATGTSPGASPPSAAAAQARALYQQALAATRGSAGFHYVAVTSGAGSQRIVGDAGPNGGRQDITDDTSYGHEQFTLLLVSSTVYFQGNAPALEDQLGVPAGSASSLDGRWISVSPGDGPYNVVAPGITVADQAQELPLVPASTEQVTLSGGAAATRIRGTIPAHQGVPAATAYLDVAGGSQIPIAYVSTLSAGSVSLTSTITFSKWGTAPSVSAPSASTAWSTLGASQPPGGYGSGGSTGTPSPSPQGTI